MEQWQLEAFAVFVPEKGVGGSECWGQPYRIHGGSWHPREGGATRQRLWLWRAVCYQARPDQEGAEVPPLSPSDPFCCCCCLLWLNCKLVGKGASSGCPHIKVWSKAEASGEWASGDEYSTYFLSWSQKHILLYKLWKFLLLFYIFRF
jgi:hypothetical protein